MSTLETLRFSTDDFRKGHRGISAPHDTDKCSLFNLRVWKDGQLGQRPAWLAEQVLTANMPQDTRIFMASWWYDFVTETPGYCAISDSRIEFYSGGSVLARQTTGVIGEGISYDSTVTRITDRLWLVGATLVNLEGLFTAGFGALSYTNVISPLEAAFGLVNVYQCAGSAVHQGRAFFWGAIDNTAGQLAHRVYYSDSVITGGNAAYGTFSSASQYFDVDGTVAGCASVGPNLFIWTTDGKWTMMQGSGDPAVATFNFLGNGRIPTPGLVPAVLDNRGYFLSSDNLSMCVLTSAGVDDKTLQHLGTQTVVTGSVPVQPSENSLVDSIMVDQKRTYHEGIWYRDDWFDLPYSGDFPYGFQFSTSDSTEMLAYFDGGGASNLWEVYLRPAVVNSPPYSPNEAHATDFAETPVGTMILPRIFHPTKQVRVKKIVMDATVWRSTELDGDEQYRDPAITVAVSDGVSGHTMTIGPGTDPLNVTSTAERRLVFTSPPHPYGQHADVLIDNLESITIQAITVEFEVSEGLIQ